VLRLNLFDLAEKFNLCQFFYLEFRPFGIQVFLL